MPDGADDSCARDYKSCEVNDLVSLCLEGDRRALDELVRRRWEMVSPTQLVAVCLAGFPEGLDELVRRDWAAVGDADLVSLWLSGFPVAFDPLVRRHWKRVVQVIRSVIGNRARAQELAQDTVLKAFKSGDTFKPGSSFWPWLRQSARNRALSEWVRAKSRPVETTLPEGFDPADTTRDWITATTQQQLKGSLASLSPDDGQQSLQTPANAGAGRLQADAEAKALVAATHTAGHLAGISGFGEAAVVDAEEKALKEWKQYVRDFRRHQDRWIDRWLPGPRLSDVRQALQMVLDGYDRTAIVDAGLYTSPEAVRTGLDRAVKNVLTEAPEAFELARRMVDDLAKTRRDLGLLDDKILFLNFFDLDRITNHG